MHTEHTHKTQMKHTRRTQEKHNITKNRQSRQHTHNARTTLI